MVGSIQCLAIILFVFLFLSNNCNAAGLTTSDLNKLSGDELYKKGLGYSAVGRNEEAAKIFWICVNKAGSSSTYTVSILFLFSKQMIMIIVLYQYAVANNYFTCTCICLYYTIK